MDEIPGIVWVIIGIFIAAVSLFLGFLRPVTYNAFFKLMFVIGIGMMIYGYIFKLKGKPSKEEILQERRQQLMQQRGEYDADIDIDDYKNNPYLRQQAMQKGYPSSQPNQQFRQNEMMYQQRLQQSKNNQQTQKQSEMNYPQFSQPMQRTHTNQGGQRFCGNCGTPLLKEHKFCPICGARV